MLEAYRHHVAERAALGIPPLPLTAQQTAEVIELLKNPPAGEEGFLLDLITNRVPAGVDDAAKVKASYLAAVAFGTERNALISRERATQLLGTMLGGYNIHPLVELLDDAQVGTVAADALKHTLLMFDAFHDVQEKADPTARRQRQCQGRAAQLGRRRVVHQPPGSAGLDDHHRLQGDRRNQHRRPVAGARRHHAPGHPAARAGDAEEQARRHRAGGRRQARPGRLHRIAEGQGPPGRLRRRRGRYGFQPQVGHQLGAVVHRRGHSVHPEQALRRRVPGQQDRPDLLQHDGRRRRAADRTGRVADEHGRRRRTAPVRRQGAEGRPGHRRVLGEVRRAVRRSARRRPHPADRRPRPDRQGARSAGPAGVHPVPPAAEPGRHRQGLLAGAEDGRPCVRLAGREGHPSGHLLRAEDDLRRVRRTPPAR